MKIKNTRDLIRTLFIDGPLDENTLERVLPNPDKFPKHYLDRLQDMYHGEPEEKWLTILRAVTNDYARDESISIEDRGSMLFCLAHVYECIRRFNTSQEEQDFELGEGVKYGTDR